MLVPGQSVLEISCVPLEEKAKVRVDIVQYCADVKYVNNIEITTVVFKIH